MVLRKKNKSPPVLSHEFMIQNHADIVSCGAMLIALGLVFEVTAKVAVVFITLQYNVTVPASEGQEERVLYQYGPKDAAAALFYALLVIVCHAVLQEYGLDRLNRRLHLSKTKHSKFNESGQLAAFYLVSVGWAAYILLPENDVTRPASLWEGYPHTEMPFLVKFFFIGQLAYWLHAIPELYFQKIKKEDMARQIQYISLYLIHIAAAYVLSLWRLGLVLLLLHYAVELVFHTARILSFYTERVRRLFTVWAVLFVVARLATLTLTVLTVWFGLARSLPQGLDLATGNFNTVTVRMSTLAAVCLTQVWMMWRFLNFQLRRWRESRHAAQAAAAGARKAGGGQGAGGPPLRSGKSRKDAASHVNGAAKGESDASPRALAKKQKSQ